MPRHRNYYVENADKWIALSDIDYFTHFVKAWIPFNAWYKNNYPDLETDFEIMQEVKSSNNNFRDRIIRLIENPNTDNDSRLFKTNLADLHYQLERNHVGNKGKRISFTDLFVEENRHLVDTKIWRGFSYKVEVDANNKKRVSSTVMDRTSITRLTFNQTNGYNLDELTIHADYKKLTPECQRILKNCYIEVNPRKCVDLLTEDTENCIKIGAFNFVNDSTLIAKALIAVIYNLRNSLFHGQLIPDSHAQLVYEPAYHILHMLVASLN